MTKRTAAEYDHDDIYIPLSVLHFRTTTISTMGKKQKEETPNVNTTPNRDIIQRLNFLYQASVYLQSLEPSTVSIPPIISKSNHDPSSRSKSKEGKAKETQISDTSQKHAQEAGGKKMKKKKKHRRKQTTTTTTGDLARNYIKCMRIVGQKTTVKMYVCLYIKEKNFFIYSQVSTKLVFFSPPS